MKHKLYDISFLVISWLLVQLIGLIRHLGNRKLSTITFARANILLFKKPNDKGFIYISESDDNVPLNV